jgi:hypothetical protein
MAVGTGVGNGEEAGMGKKCRGDFRASGVSDTKKIHLSQVDLTPHILDNQYLATTPFCIPVTLRNIRNYLIYCSLVCHLPHFHPTPSHKGDLFHL